MKVKEFVEMAKNENAIVEVHFETKGSIGGKYSCIAHHTKSSLYGELDPYMDKMIKKFRTYNGVAPVYSILDTLNGSDSTKYDKTYQLYI